MKNILTLMFAMTVCYVAKAQAPSHFGKEINDKKAIEASALPAKMADKDVMEVKVTGTVASVCQVKGCWMTVNLADGQTMRVMFKDYGFFVPKDIAGKTVVFEGEAQKKVVPVEHLKHYAQDAGKSKEEIAKITKPENELTFIAAGVIVK
jgi:hypothetical protein